MGCGPLGLINDKISLLVSQSPEPRMGALAALLTMEQTTPAAALKPLVRRGLMPVTTAACSR